MMRSVHFALYLFAPIALFAACSSDEPSTDSPTDGGVPDAAPSPDGAQPDTGPASTCTDATKNGTESDVDCGGSCPPCAAGKACTTAADCASGSCIDKICAGFSTAVRIDDPAEGPPNPSESLWQMLEDGDGVPIALYAEMNVAETANQIYARAFVGGAWEAKAKALSLVAEAPGHQFRPSRPVVVGKDLFIPFNSGECCDAQSMYVARRHAGVFETPILIAGNTSDNYFAANGTEVTAISEATTGGEFHISASTWNGTSFSPSAFAETTGDEANVDPTQVLFDSTARWNGWVVFQGNTTPGTRKSLLAARQTAGAWSTLKPIDVPTDGAAVSSPIAIHAGTGSEATVAFTQQAGGLQRLRVNHIADGATDWDGPTTIAPAVSVYSNYPYPTLVSLDGSSKDMMVVVANASRSSMVAAHGVANVWGAATSIVPAPGVSSLMSDVARLDGATGALLCLVGTVSGKREAWVMAFQNGAWTTASPVLPLGTGGARSCSVFPDGNRVVALYTIGGKDVLRVARWTSAGLSPVTAVGVDEAAMAYGLSLLPSTARHPPRLVYLGGENGARKLYAADWPDTGIQPPRRLDADASGGVDSVSAVALPSGKEGLLYQEAAGPKGVYAVFGY